MSSWTSSPTGRSGGGGSGSVRLSISPPGFSSVVLVIVAGETGLEQPCDDEPDNRSAGKRNAGAVAHEVARILDQLVRVLFGEGVGRVLDRPCRAPCIIAILADKPPGPLACLARKLLAPTAEALGQAPLGTVVRSCLQGVCSRRHDLSVPGCTRALLCGAVIVCSRGALDHRVGTFRQSCASVVTVLSNHGPVSFFADSTRSLRP